MTSKSSSLAADPAIAEKLGESRRADGGKMATTLSADGKTAVFSRLFDAPRAAVYRAWVEPARLARWWGPRTFANPVVELDVRPGGSYRIVMRSPEGVDYPMRGVYLEVVPNERLVMTDIVDEHPADWFELLARYRGESGAAPLAGLLAVSFAESAGRTLVEVAYTAEKPADLAAIVMMGMAEGWAESFAALEELLAAR